MSYLTYEQYTAMGESTYKEAEFTALERKAERYLDRLTLTVDHVRKLQVAFPTNETDVLTIHECLVELMKAIDTIEACADMNSDAASTGRGGIIASASSGSESVTYVTEADILQAAIDPTAKSKYLYQIIRTYLEGVQDANGVNILYGGRYPHVF